MAYDDKGDAAEPSFSLIGAARTALRRAAGRKEAKDLVEPYDVADRDAAWTSHGETKTLGVDIRGIDGSAMAAAGEQQSSASAAFSEREKEAEPQGVPTRLSTDKPTKRDSLGFLVYAKAIAQFLVDAESKPPLTISIQAPWGGGKTSMMLMLEDELDPQAQRYRPPKSPQKYEKLTVRDFKRELKEQLDGRDEPELPKLEARGNKNMRTTVWFNAWKYENTNQVWAGLVDAILQQVPKRMPRRERELFWLRLNLSRIDSGRIRQNLHEFLINRVFRSTAGLIWSGLAAIVTFGATLLGVMRWQHFTLPSGVGVSGLVAGLGAVLAKWIGATFEFQKEAASEMFKNIVRAPTYDTELGFVHQVESDLRRVFEALPTNEGLVVFIDDLDRCSPMKVAAVLEAVNLIIAGDFPDCYFVLGMDAEMVAAALQVAHKDLTAGAPDDSRIPIGWRFMDKFVQLPFIVPPVDRDKETSLLHYLWKSAKTENEVPTGPPTGKPSLRATEDMQDFVELSGSLAPLFHGNPRELKRFTNLLRFHWYLSYARSDAEGDNAAPTVGTQALAYWTAMSVKWPEHVRWLRRLDSRMSAVNVLNVSSELTDEAAQAALKTLTVLKGLNHLRILETLASGHGITFKIWQNALKGLYGMGDKVPLWVGDALLFDFYRELAIKLVGDEAPSAQVGRGFW